MSAALAWPLLLLAGVLDVVWAASMKLSHGYTRMGWTVASVLALLGFVALLGRVLTVLPVGVAYAVWTGIGAVGTVVVGAVFFDETFDAAKVAAIALIVAGIVVLRWQGTA